MSYSFNIRAATVALALAAVASEFDAIVAREPAHHVDKDKALSAVASYLELVPTAHLDGYELSVAVSGGIGGEWDGDTPQSLNFVAFSVQAAWVSPAVPT